MYSILQSQTARGTAGEPLNQPWDALNELDVKFNRGDIVLVCGPSGTGKSAFSLNLAMQSEAPTLYFSGDSNAFTQMSRAIAIAADITVDEAKKLVLADDLERVAQQVSKYPIQFCYSASPSQRDLEDHIAAYQELYGVTPDLIVIDNITNVYADPADSQSQTLEGLMSLLNEMARSTQSCVLTLHHVTANYNDGDKPIPLSGVKDQIHRVPTIVLTLHKIMQEGFPAELRVSPVKNREGEPDSTGHKFATLKFEGEKMLITDGGVLPHA